MSNIKNFDSFVNENYKVDESWRQVKAWLKLPVILLDRLLSKILNYVPQLNFQYDQLAAKIDLGKGLSPEKIQNEPEKLSLSDIKNKKMKNSLKASGIFDKWNVYYMRTIDPDRKFNVNDNSRDVIYISKDELKKGDTYYGERISESRFSKHDTRKMRKTLRKTGAEKYADLEPQMFVVVAKHSEEHDKMKGERDERYTAKEKKELEKLVDKCIKDEDLTGYSKSIAGDWSRDPVLAKVVRADRIDLAEKLINACFDYQEVINMIEEEYGDSEYEMDANVFKKEKDKISDDMKKFLEHTLKLARSERVEKEIVPYFFKY